MKTDNAFQILLKSKAFWTALIAVISAIVMVYTNVPQEIWIPVEALLGSVVIVFTGAEVGDRVGIGMARALRSYDEEKFGKKP